MPPNKVVRKAAAARTPGTKAKQNFAEDDIFMMIPFVLSCGSFAIYVARNTDRRERYYLRTQKCELSSRYLNEFLCT